VVSKGSTQEVEVAYSTEKSVFNGLHGVISKKIELFITTSVRTSDPKI
jgi:hypothetical protein